MKTTRQHILEYLNIKGAATSIEISHALHLTQANIRRHLGILLEEGAVKVIDERSGGKAGRPTRLYGSSHRVTAHNLAGLANILLEEITVSHSPQEREEFIRKIARRLAGKHKPAAQNFTQRLTQAVQQLNAMNYSSRWEARPDTPRLILGHCPYAAILPEHPELCMIDAALLEELLGTPVLQIARLERTPQGLRQCIFQIQS